MATSLWNAPHLLQNTDISGWMVPTLGLSTRGCFIMGSWPLHAMILHAHARAYQTEGSLTLGFWLSEFQGL